MFYLKNIVRLFHIYSFLNYFGFGFFEAELGFVKNCIWVLRTGFTRRDAQKSYSEV